MTLLAFVFVLVLGIAGTAWFLKVAGKPAPPPALADRLNWSSTPYPGVVKGKDGSFMIGFRFRGPDATSVPKQAVNRMAKRFGESFLRYTDEWCFHIDLYRTEAVGYAPPGAFPDLATRVIDDERRQSYESAGKRYETECYLTATWRPPSEGGSKLASLFRIGEPDGPTEARQFELFKRSVLDFADRLEGVLEMERLDTSGLLGHLYRTLTGRKQTILTPFHGSYLDVVLCHEPYVGDFSPRIGDQQICAVGFQGYPEEVWPTQLEVLSELPMEFRWSMRVLPMSPPKADARIRRSQKQAREQRKSAGSLLGEVTRGKDSPKDPEWEKMQEDQHALDLAKGASEAIALNSSGKVRYCFVSCNLVVHRSTTEESQETARELIKVLRGRGFTAQVEKMNGDEAFIGTLPGHGGPNLRKPLLSTQNLASLAPITSSWAGPKENSSPYYPAGSPPLFWADTTGSTPFRVSLHSAGDLSHTLIVGPTGAGKSTVMQLIAAQQRRYPDAQVFAFDKGRSFELLCRASGGAHFRLQAGEVGGLTFQPLGNVDQETERSWAVDWLGTLLKAQGVDLSPARSEILMRALVLLGEQPKRYRTMTALWMQANAADKEMGAALKVYTATGSYGSILDGDQDSESEADFQVFEMHDLLDLGEEITTPVLFYVLHKLDKRFNAGRPTVLIVDEAKSSLGHPDFEKKIKEYAVTLRKRNVTLILAFQSLEQLHELSARSVLMDSCPTKIYLPNPDAASEDNQRRYKDFGLNEKEIEMLSGATPKRHYYFRGPSSSSGSRLFELGLGPAAHAFFFARKGLGVEGTLERAALLERQHGAEWPAIWLDEAGAHDAASRYRTYLGGLDVLQHVA